MFFFKTTVPRIPPSFFFASMFLGLLGITVLTLHPFVYPVIIEDRIVQSIFYCIDPILIQFVSAIVLALLLGRCARGKTRLGLRWSLRKPLLFFARFIAICVLLILLYLLDRFFLRGAFSYETTQVQGNDSFLTQNFLFALLKSTGTCPSGFVLRQVWLLMVGLSYATSQSTDRQPRFYALLRDRRILAYLFVLFLLTILLILQRIIRNVHSVFDIGITLGTAIYLFWLVYYIRAFLAKRHLGELYTDMVAASCVFLPLFFFYSQSAWQWGWASIVIFCVLGTIEQIRPHERRPTNAPR